MPRQNKYETHVKPYLKYIEGLCRRGVLEEDIAKKLNVAYSTFRNYKNEYEELKQVLKTSRDLADVEIENSLFMRAKGYDYIEEERKPMINPDTGEVEMVVAKAVNRHVPADIKAQTFWLTNRKPEDWKQKQSIEADVEVNKKLEDLL